MFPFFKKENLSLASKNFGSAIVGTLVVGCIDYGISQWLVDDNNSLPQLESDLAAAGKALITIVGFLISNAVLGKETQVGYMAGAIAQFYLTYNSIRNSGAEPASVISGTMLSQITTFATCGILSKIAERCFPENQEAPAPARP